MPSFALQPVQNSENEAWVEGHGLQWKPNDMDSICIICEERSDEGIYRCCGCTLSVHGRCAHQVCLVCPVAFHEDQVRAAFVRCFASLLYTYRKFLQPASGTARQQGKLYRWNSEGFLKSLPREASDYVSTLISTQSFNEFIHDRELLPPNHTTVKLFDQIVLSKRNRGASSLFSKSNTSYLSDISSHIWRSVTVTPPTSRFPGDYRAVTSRIPAKLDPVLMRPGKEQTFLATTTVRPMQFEFGVGQEATIMKAKATTMKRVKRAPQPIAIHPPMPTEDDFSSIGTAHSTEIGEAL